jgi:hypothetical protein
MTGWPWLGAATSRTSAHDDVWHPTHLETMVATIEESQVDLVYALTLLIGPADAPYRDIRGFEPPGGHQRDISLPPSAIMHRRERGLEVGGWRDFRQLVHYPDYDFLARLWDAGGRFAPTNRLTVFKFPAAMRPNSYVLKPSLCMVTTPIFRRQWLPESGAGARQGVGGGVAAIFTAANPNRGYCRLDPCSR